MSYRTIQRWVKRFENKGFAGLQEVERVGRPSKLNEKQWDAIGRELRINPRELGYPQNLWDGKLLAHHLKQIYGVDQEVRQCQRIFRQMRFRLRKPNPVIAKADPEAQTAYKKTSPIRQNEIVDLWSLDECHFQQYGTRCVMWVSPEETDPVPVLLHAPTQKSIGLFGAVNLRFGHGLVPNFFT